MKRFTDFVTQNLTGGAGFNNDDFFQVLTEVYNVLEGISAGMVERLGKGTSGVISGCEITPNGGNFDVAAGIVYLNTAAGIEIRVFSAQTNITAGVKYIIPESDLNEQRLYENGISKNFFVTKRATLGANETGAIAFDPSLDNLPFIQDLLVQADDVESLPVDIVSPANETGLVSTENIGDTETITVNASNITGKDDTNAPTINEIVCPTGTRVVEWDIVDTAGGQVLGRITHPDAYPGMRLVILFKTNFGIAANDFGGPASAAALAFGAYNIEMKTASVTASKYDLLLDDFYYLNGLSNGKYVQDFDWHGNVGSGEDVVGIFTWTGSYWICEELHLTYNPVA